MDSTLDFSIEVLKKGFVAPKTIDLRKCEDDLSARIALTRVYQALKDKKITSKQLLTRLKK